MADIIVDDGLLVAYADNQLDSEQRELVEKALQSSESLRLKLNKFNTSGAILRANLDVGQEVIPDHIRHRILMLDQQIKKERIRPRIETEDFTRDNGVLEIPAFLRTSTVEESSLLFSFSGIDILEPSVFQNDVEIPNFGTITPNDSFSIVWASPLDGDFSIFEITGDNRKLLFSGKALDGSFLDVPPLVRVSAQSELKLEIKVKNSEETVIITKEIRLKVVSVQNNKEKWEQGFSELLAYKKEFGDCLVTQGYKTETSYPLSQWISEQRFDYKTKKIHEERIKRLEKLGFDWVA